MTLGGIDLNSSGRYKFPVIVVYKSISNFIACVNILVCSVVVREDKKLLTVLFPDGRDGRAFTLKVISIFTWLT